jgi:peptidoglycan/LPS O-acetylase OafA/YrhL
MPVVNVGIALVVDWSLRYPTSAVGRLLNTSAVSYVGTLSYSLYIWQEVFLDRHHTSPLLRFPLNLIFAVAAAVASYYVVERPSLRLRARLERRWSSDPNGASDPRGRMSVAA